MSPDLNKQLRQRIWVLAFFFLMLIMGITARLFYLQVIKHGFFKQKTVAQQQHAIKITANRGTIYDRNNKVLATSIETLSLYATPKTIKDKQALATQLAPLLKKSATEILNKIDNDRYFVWLERKLEPQTVAAIKALDLRGIGFISEQKRIYPRKNFAAHVLGFVGIDDIGLGGVEQFYDKQLGGEPGQLLVDRSPYGDEIYCGLRTLRPKVDGANVQLTIDEFVQYTAERALKKAVQTYKAKSGSIIVMDPRTGEVLALACAPDYDPNEYTKASDAVRLNTTVQTVYEPGSTLKPLTLAGAFADGVITDTTRIVNGTSYKVDDRYINDLHAEKAVNLQRSFTPEEILVFSLNIGTAKIGQKLGKGRLYAFLQAFGLGKPSGIELPGESGGILRMPVDWSKADEAMIPFGQGVAVTPIQMLMSINAFGNNGIVLKPQLVKRIVTNEKKVLLENCAPKQLHQAVPPEIAHKILKYMQEAVEKGTGIAAVIPGYTVAGKTGTAQKADHFGGGYLPNEYVASFVGLIPANKPRLSILVILDAPKYGMYGGTVAAPVFREVAEAILYYMNIPPDRSR